MTMPKRGRGRPRKKIRFFSDDAANDQWNAQRGKVKRSPTPLALRLAKGADETDAEIKRFWRVGPYVPLEMAHRLEGIGDGPITIADEAVLKDYELAKAKRGTLTRNAAAEKRTAAASRKLAVLSNAENRNLLRALVRGKHTANTVATIIRRYWKDRGDGGQIVSVRTLNGWLREFAVCRTIGPKK